MLGGTLLAAAFTAVPSARCAPSLVRLEGGAPREGDCPECVGVVNDLLNSCPEETEACVSSQNDDEYHFAAPWAYPGDRATAMRRLVAVAVGTERGRAVGTTDVITRPGSTLDDDGGHVAPPVDVDIYGRDRREVREWILNTTGAFVLNRPLPERPRVVGKPSRVGGGVVGLVLGGPGGRADDRSNGATSYVTEVAAYDETTGYVRLVVAGDGGASGMTEDGETGAEARDVFDMEFLFWDDDEVCNIRVASRDTPKSGKWSLSYVDGVRFNKNSSRGLAEGLRIALGWEILPVISEFDPRFNNSKRLWFEKALTPMFDPSVMDTPHRGAGH